MVKGGKYILNNKMVIKICLIKNLKKKMCKNILLSLVYAEFLEVLPYLC